MKPRMQARDNEAPACINCRHLQRSAFDEVYYCGELVENAEFYAGGASNIEDAFRDGRQVARLVCDLYAGPSLDKLGVA